MSIQELHNFIGGEYVASSAGRWLDNWDPARGVVYSRLPDSDRADVARAVDAAEEAFESWAALPANNRADCLRGLADAMEARLDVLAEAECVDSGKPLARARELEIPRAVSNFRFFASAIEQFASESHSTATPGTTTTGVGTQVINYTLRQPLGAVACISPWNLPLYLFSWKIAPALAAGNTVVAKPSEITPMTAFLLGEICSEAGLPPGVLNIVQGTGASAGQAIVEHPSIKAISFTGGTETGARIAATAGPEFKKLSLELGGKNPTLVFADCDFDRALDGAVRAAFSNQGQICLCGPRVFVERSLYARFRDAFVERTAALIVGDPLESRTDQGALVSEAHMEKVLDYVNLAHQEGGTLLTGGERVRLSGRCARGWFMQPTVFEDLPHDCRTNQEEIFGPVATLIPFDTEDEVVAWANSTRYGLAASLWSQDVSRCHRIAHALDSGILWINCWMVRDLRTPFGGMKDSGVGREGGFEALRFFSETKNICIQF